MYEIYGLKMSGLQWAGDDDDTEDDKSSVLLSV